MRLEDLNGRELRDARKALGAPLPSVFEAGDPDAMYAVVWLFDRRDDPTLTLDDVLEYPLGEVTERLETELETDPDPTTAGSGAD